MKALKIVLLVLLVFLVGGAIMLGLAFLPAVQKRIFLAAANEEGRTVAVDRVSAGFDGLELDNFALQVEGADLAIERVRVKLPVTRLIGDREKIDIDEIIVEGIKADIRSTSALVGDGASDTPEGPSEKPNGDAGEPTKFDTLKLPVALTIGTLSISGEATLPDSGSGRPHGNFALSGGDFAPGQEMKLTLSGAWTDPSQPGLAEGVELDGEIAIHQTEGAAIDRASVRLDTPLASGTAQLSAPGGRIAEASADGSFTADLAKLVVFVPADVRPPLKRGTISQQFEARRDAEGVLQFTSTGSLENLAGGPEETTFAAIELNLTASVPREGAAAVSAKLAAKPGGGELESDASLTGTVQPPPQEDGDAVVDLQLTSQRIAVEGLMRLVDLAVPPDKTEDEPEAPEPPDEVPVWDGVSGRIAFSAAEVLLPEGATMRDTKGTITIEASKVTISGLQGVALESPFKGGLAIAFAPDAGGYKMEGGISLERFDAGKAFATLQSGDVPQLEGLFATEASFSATGGTLAGLAEQPSASISIHGSEGVFRGLKRTADSASSIIGLIGSITKSDEVAGVSKLASSLANIPYEEVAIEATLDAGRSVAVNTFLLRSTNLILEGSGSLGPSEDKSFLRWPLGLQLNLAGKGEVAQLLQTLHVAAPEANENGFVELRFPFKLGGSLASPDAGDLWRNLAREAAASLFDGSRSKSTPEAPPADAGATGPTPQPED
ncbi:MAG: hypothetical protein ACREIA_14235 [Opitutaceae bacterium]